MESIVANQDTIAAIASAVSLGKGGIAVIRVSGEEAINSCKNIVETKSKYAWESHSCLLYTSPSPRDRTRSRMPSSA